MHNRRTFLKGVAAGLASVALIGKEPINAHVPKPSVDQAIQAGGTFFLTRHPKKPYVYHGKIMGDWTLLTFDKVIEAGGGADNINHIEMASTVYERFHSLVGNNSPFVDKIEVKETFKFFTYQGVPLIGNRTMNPDKIKVFAFEGK